MLDSGDQDVLTNCKVCGWQWQGWEKENILKGGWLGESLELVLDDDLELAVLWISAWCPRIQFSMCAASINSVTIQWECLEMQSFVSTPDYWHWEPEVWVLSIHWINVMHRAIWDSFHRGECSVVIQTCWEHSLWLAVVSSSTLLTFYISFCFKRGGSKEKWCQNIGEEKTRAFRQGQAETSWQICTSSKADQMHFPKANHKDHLPSWWCGQALSMRGDPGRSCSKSVHSGGCRSSRPTALKESLSGPWTAQIFCG